MENIFLNSELKIKIGKHYDRIVNEKGEMGWAHNPTAFELTFEERIEAHKNVTNLQPNQSHNQYETAQRLVSGSKRWLAENASA